MRRAKADFLWHLELFRCNLATSRDFWAHLKATIPDPVPSLDSLDNAMRALFGGQGNTEPDAQVQQMLDTAPKVPLTLEEIAVALQRMASNKSSGIT